MKVAKTEVPDDLHARFAACCKAQGRTMADRLRELMAQEVGAQPAAPPCRERRTRQVNVLLTEELHAGLRAHAAAHGARCSQAVYAMVRALVARAPTPSLAEIDALYESNRCVRTLARELERMRGQADPVTAAEIVQVRRAFEAHTATVTAVVDAALNRWRVEP